MPSRFHRNILLRINCYQKKILYPVLISSLVACNVIVICYAFFYYPLDHKIIFHLTLQDIRYALPWMLAVVSVMLIFVVFWTYYMSNKLVGPYTRILRELDEILETGRKKEIKTRQGDAMFEDLLKRVNDLIRQLP